jgi:hypothetical protein
LQPYVPTVSSDLDVDVDVAGEEVEDLAGVELLEVVELQLEVVELEVVELEGAATPADRLGTCHGSALRETQRLRNDGAWE